MISPSSITSWTSAAATAPCCRPRAPPTRTGAAAGDSGWLLSACLAAYPNRRATLFDMAEAIAAAKRGEGGPLPGVSFVAGDVFSTPAPDGGDASLLRHLMHDY